jgi:2-dehydropantoate 2-reductase
MKIGVVGCGALGSFYGAKLLAAGADVHFLLRSDYDAVRRGGVRIRSFAGDLQVHPRCARRPEEIGPCDMVVIGLKTTANDAFARLLPPLVGKETAVLTLQNGLGNEERLAKLFGSDQVLGGLCFVCLNRVAPGEVHHTAHGDVLLGEYQRPPGERTRAYAALFHKAGVPCQVTENLDKAHWQKLVWNVPFNGLGVASAAGYRAVCTGRVLPSEPLGPCLPTDALLKDPRWLGLVRDLMGEVITAAAELGLPLRPGLVEEQIERTSRMGAYKASTLIDFERGQPLELESLFVEPLRRAGAACVAMPRLTSLCQVLAQLDPGKKDCCCED